MFDFAFLTTGFASLKILLINLGLILVMLFILSVLLNLVFNMLKDMFTA